jgi:hypothetical protein
MISTHNHVDMAASLVGAGPVRGDATAAHPSKQLGHRQATARAGSTAALRAGSRGTLHPATCPGGLSPSGHAQPAQPNHRTQHHTRGGPGRRQPTRRDHSDPDRRGMARPSSVCPAWVGEQCKHGCADAQWQTPRRRRRTDGARLRRNPNLRRGRLHHPAFPVQPRFVLRDPPRMGPAGGDSAAATPLLSCRDRWSAQLGYLACLRTSASKATVVVNAQVGCWVSWPGWSWLDR